jgi:hypothetical protein
VVLVAGHDGESGGGLRLRDRRHLFGNHTARLGVGAGAARSKPHHAQRHDALGLDAELDRFKRNAEPWIEHAAPPEFARPRRRVRRVIETRARGNSFAERARRHPASLSRSAFGAKRERKIYGKIRRPESKP